MKGSFKLNWIFGQFTNLRLIRQNIKILKNPCSFYLGVIIKLFPIFKKISFNLKFKDGTLIRIHDFMSFYIYAEIFVDGCYDVELDSKMPVIVDVGANTGYFALRMKQLYPDAKILCFEPYPPCVQQLKETIEINHLDNIVIKELAVSDKAEKSKLYIHPSNIAGHSIFSENVSENYVNIESVTLNELAEMLKSPQVCDLLKLDCEGAEYPILKSIDAISIKHFPQIIYEPTYDSYDIDELNKSLKEKGYQVNVRQSLYLAKSTQD